MNLSPTVTSMPPFVIYCNVYDIVRLHNSVVVVDCAALYICDMICLAACHSCDVLYVCDVICLATCHSCVIMWQL